MKSVLVTGAAGFIGVNYVRRRLEVGDERMVALDSLTYAGNGRSLEPLVGDRLDFVNGDIRDTELVEKLIRQHDCGTIVHFAAESHVDRSISGPDAFISTNVDGTHSLLKAARNCWLSGDAMPHRFHHVSTDEVYGSLTASDPPFSEENQYQPNSPYSASKAASDHLVRAYHHTFGLDVTTTNCSNNYGPYQFPEKLIPLMIVKILHGEALPVYGDGMQIRDWLYVEDHCRAIELCLEKGVAGEVYNIGGDNERPNIEIVHSLCDMMESRILGSEALAERFPDCPASRGDSNRDLISHVTDRPGHDRRYAIDYSKAEAELGYVPEHTFSTGFERTIDWYLAEEAWWRSVMDGSYRDWIDTNYQGRG
ncbi:MAG: dTDP-glucose 4,6-dehydratase [Phycisphaerae bacterium]|nr:dTDP-glucose 4,6-dehydratase [Phycisphaerae bacterium]